MTKQVQIRRGSAMSCDAFTGAHGEVVVSTGVSTEDTSYTLRVHDGFTKGGWRLINDSILEKRLVSFKDELKDSDIYLTDGSQTITGTINSNIIDNKNTVALRILYPYGSYKDIQFVAQQSTKGENDSAEIITDIATSAIRSSRTDGGATTVIGNMMDAGSFSGALTITTSSTGKSVTYMLDCDPNENSRNYEIATTSWVSRFIDKQITNLSKTLGGSIDSLDFLSTSEANKLFIPYTGCTTTSNKITGTLWFNNPTAKSLLMLRGDIKITATEDNYNNIVAYSTATKTPRISEIRFGNDKTGKNYVWISPFNNTGDWVNDGIKVVNDGAVNKTYAITPENNANDSQIATTKWCKTNCVSTAGGTMNGILTFVGSDDDAGKYSGRIYAGTGDFKNSFYVTTGSNEGSYLRLGDNEVGNFTLNARKGVTEHYGLNGYSDGRLTWNKIENGKTASINNVLCENGFSLKNSGYIKLTNDLVFGWSRVASDTTSGSHKSKVQKPIKFKTLVAYCSDNGSDDLNREKQGWISSLTTDTTDTFAIDGKDAYCVFWVGQAI